MLEAHELVSVRIGERLDQHRIDDAEDRRRRANPQREGDESRRGEARRPPQRADDVPQVAKKVVEGHRAELIARALSRPIDRAELEERLPPRLVGRQAGATILLGLLIEMKADLFVEPAFEGAKSRQRTHPTPGLFHPPHVASDLVTRWLRRAPG